MRVAVYRLGRYRIIESGSGELSWEAHFGLSEYQEGRCFKKGAVLFIGPAENQGPGFLIGEFLEQLQHSPAWLKTEYYCRGLDVYHCETGKKVTQEEMLLWMFERSNDQGGTCRSKYASFRLQRYEITNRATGQVTWKTYAGPNTGRSGVGSVMEDILFIVSFRHQPIVLNKQEFINNLKRLPKWDATAYYCLNLPLHKCRSIGNGQAAEKRWWSERPVTDTNHTGKEPKHRTVFKSGTFDRFKNVAVLLSRWMFECIIKTARLAQSLIYIFFLFMVWHWKKFKGKM